MLCRFRRMVSICTENACKCSWINVQGCKCHAVCMYNASQLALSSSLPLPPISFNFPQLASPFNLTHPCSPCP
jgi:hypothetical protein